MIGQLKGILAVKKSPYLVIDVQGVGYEVQASMTTIYALPTVGAQVFLYTHLIVREDAHLLYGFADEGERMVFRQLIKVNGVGPKLALTILSGMNVANLIDCIEKRDTSRLVKLPGVGSKTAERLLVEMRDKLDRQFNTPVEFNTVFVQNNQTTTMHQQDAASALIALGYKPQEAHATISKVYIEDADSETLIRLALQRMVK